MADGWSELGRVLGGGVNTDDAYSRGATRAAQLEGLIADAQMKRNKAQAQAQMAGALAKMGDDPNLATVFASGYDPRQLSGYRGDVQEQVFRGDAVARALAGDFTGANANLFGVASGPQALATVEGQNLIANRFAEGGGGVTTTEQGRAGAAADYARADSSRASAASSYASAARTRQAAGIDAARFGLERSGQWNPGGKPAATGGGGGEKPLPVAALKPLLEIEDALGGTQVMSDIIGKHTRRMKEGSLVISPWDALMAKGRTAAGIASDNDVAINEWNADKTKIVNESLRLNKGVQTEGDAQRAANELMAANDEATATRALERLAEINAHAVQLQVRKRDLINTNYGRAPTQSLGDVFGGQAPAAGAAVQRARNPSTGQTMVLVNGQWVPE